MIERFLIVALFGAIGFIVFHWYSRWQLARIAAHAHFDPILNGIQVGLPTIVYFTIPNCIPCKTQQQPVLQKLRETQAVQVIQIDATEQPEAAQRWGVMTAPTTFVLDAELKPKSVNHGVTGELKLLKQINEAMQSA